MSIIQTKVPKKSNDRTVKYELLRVISACFILFNHITISLKPGEAVTAIQQFNYHMITFFHLGGKFGVNVFVILGCYFLCRSPFKPERIYRLITEVVFYSLILNFIDMFVFGTSLSLLDFIHGFSYWFPVSYIFMLLCSPLLNRLSDLGYGRKLSITGMLFFTCMFIWGMLYPNNLFKLVTLDQIAGSIWFCYLYILTSYLRSCGFFENSLISKYARFTFPLSYLIMYLLLLLTGRSLIRAMFSPLCLISALSLFLIFHHTSEKRFSKHRRLITPLAGSSLGMYLIQTHNNTAGIWANTVFKYDKWTESVMLLPICILSVFILIIFAVMINFIFNLIKNIRLTMHFGLKF